MATTYSVARYTSTDTIGNNTVIIIDLTESKEDGEFTLPSLSGIDGRFYIIARIDNTEFNCTIYPDGEETIDGQSEFALFGGNSVVTLVGDEDSTNWLIQSDI